MYDPVRLSRRRNGPPSACFGTMRSSSASWGGAVLALSHQFMRVTERGNTDAPRTSPKNSAHERGRKWGVFKLHFELVEPGSPLREFVEQRRDIGRRIKEHRTREKAFITTTRLPLLLFQSQTGGKQSITAAKFRSLWFERPS